MGLPIMMEWISMAARMCVSKIVILKVGMMHFVSKLHPVAFHNGYRWHLPEHQINEQTETTGRAALLIYLLQNNIISKEEVNSLVESHERKDSEQERDSSTW